MGEDLFVCDCGEATSDYRGGQCGRCYELHCMRCHRRFLEKYGEKKGCLAKCDKCADNTDDESEEDSEDESEEESESESEKKPEGEPLTAESFLAIIGKFNDEAEKREQQEKPEIIWRARADLPDRDNNVYFKDKEDGKRYILDRMKELLDDEQNWDEDGDLCFEFEFGLQHYTLN